ncbi:MAG: SDR family NAD(P)-dependent oxidoreductase [Chitinophagaceae bacterium]|nr:MAG: SDR family NAD(P)-dependent oxidoreductase [Chitinophagaceae bacterium]
MKQKTVVVTGASGNLGNAIVTHYLKLEYKVLGLVHHSKKMQSNDLYYEYEVNLLNADEVNSCINKIIQEHQSIDIAVLTAGGFTMGNLSNSTYNDIDKQIQLNFVTAYNVIHPILMQMKVQNSGEIFFIGSLAGMDAVNGKNVTAYSLSKSLLFQLAGLINVEYAEQSIHAHVIVPSIIDTTQNRADMPNADFSKWEKPEQIAAIIEKYANDKNQKSKTVIVVQEEI